MADPRSSGGTDGFDNAGERLLSLLRDIENRCLENAVGLPQEETVEEIWEGVLFSVAGRLLIAPLGQVKEIRNFPAAITPVPGTKSWVRGVANIHGNLLPIIDLQAFLFDRTTVPGRRSRVLVIEHEGVSTSLLVDQLVGIKRFLVSDQAETPADLPDTLRRFVELSYRSDDQIWPVFSMHRMIENAGFQFAAA